MGRRHINPFFHSFFFFSWPVWQQEIDSKKLDQKGTDGYTVSRDFFNCLVIFARGYHLQELLQAIIIIVQLNLEFQTSSYSIYREK